ncbi:hypothetical protein AcW2_006999 [Taiwanofungus camphoratus]|nr:hypothetical protein AcW2_006999 [Antrodia cinnamomea]
MKPTTLRLALYIALWFFSVLLLSLTSARLHYTTHLPKGDTLNAGVDFYDPIVVELLVCSIMALGFAPFVLRLGDRFAPGLDRYASAPVTEPLSLSILWLLWLVGSAVSISIWPNLSFCYQFEACRVLSAMMAFAWLGWITICGLLVVSGIIFLKKRRAHQVPVMVEWAFPATATA